MAAVPVVLGDFGIALHDVARGIDASELLEGEQSLRAAFALDDAMAHGLVFRGEGSGLVVVVDEVRHGGELAAVGRAMYPVVEHVVDEVEHASPSD